ncbi:DUF7689 domain-containing protein [Sorangium sp. So ce1182]|uniref:DUF7689 domain-containing protein n=1 Tax=Sorangium sp. So ce1182 TaxID=3133334 RepID=UPI003F600EA1
MVKPEWKALWPKLEDDSFRESSQKTETYNCIAFAAGDTLHWWEPYVIPPTQHGIYWPSSATPDNTLDAWAEAFATCGFVPCEDGSLEEGLVKVAIYADEEDTPQHAARQLADGRWASKLGDLEDIEHTATDALEEGEYGRVKLYLQRPRRAEDP